MEETSKTLVQDPLEERHAKGGPPETVAGLIRKVRKYTRHKVTSEDKIRIILEGMKREVSIADLCRQEKINPAIYYSWLKDFMEAGKARLKGDSLREANRDEVIQLKQENEQLKVLMAEQMLENALLKKSLTT